MCMCLVEIQDTDRFTFTIFHDFFLLLQFMLIFFVVYNFYYYYYYNLNSIHFCLCYTYNTRYIIYDIFVGNWCFLRLKKDLRILISQSSLAQTLSLEFPSSVFLSFPTKIGLVSTPCEISLKKSPLGFIFLL